MSEKILIVDDEADILNTLERILVTEGYLAKSASNGQKALELLKSEPFDLVITDIRMPGMDGVELINQIQQLNKNIEIVVLTGFASLENAIQLLRMVVVFDYLTKPLDDIERLINTVNQALEKRRLRLENKKRTAELERVYKELKASEERYRMLIDKMANGFTLQEMIYDENGKPCDYRFLEVNQAFEEMTGRKAAEVIGKTMLEVLPNSEPHWLETYGRVVLTGETAWFEGYSQQLGNYYEVLAYSPLKDHFATVSTKITDRKKMQDELIRAKKLESIGVLAGGIAHDYNNLLSVIMGNIELAKDNVKLDFGVSEFLKEAEEASLRAQQLTKQLITFSKGGAPVKKVYSIGDLVKETTNLHLLGSNVKSELIFPDDLWIVEFDEGQMKHAVKNIIDNAVESMPNGGTIDVRAENFNITPEQNLLLLEGKYIKLSIQDHGVGIPEEHLSMIFDPYFSTKEMGTQKGMGLGLATTYSIIKKHDGHINAESEVGVGTTFTVYLPVVVEETAGIKPVKVVEPEKPAVSTGRILVMDDEEAIRRLSKQMLSRLSYEPELAKDGAEAIKLYKRAMDSGKPFDTVILDLTIKGGIGGKEVIKQLMKIDPGIKAIVSSGYSNDPVMANFRAYGFIGALPKPYTKKDLDDMLNQVLGKS